MDRPSDGDITRLLRDWRAGDQAARDKLFQLVEEELRRLARRALSREHPNHTLQPTELINEAYLRLAGAETNTDWQNRAHFFAVSAKIMRHFLVDYARKHRRRKSSRAPLDDVSGVTKETDEDIVIVNEALCHLAEFDLRKCRIVEMRFFGGLTEEETAEVLGLAPRTIRMEWQIARAWLRRELKPEVETEPE